MLIYFANLQVNFLINNSLVKCIVFQHMISMAYSLSMKNI